MLEPDELKRRIEAARVLRGLTQAQLAELLVQDGLGKHDLGRIERGSMAMQRIHRDAIARHLRVPERWLTEPEVDVIVGLRPDVATQTDALGLLERALPDLVPGLRQALEAAPSPAPAQGRRKRA